MKKYFRICSKYGAISLCILFVIWAMSWENLLLPYANNKTADQPVHPHSLFSAFVQGFR